MAKENQGHTQDEVTEEITGRQTKALTWRRVKNKKDRRQRAGEQRRKNEISALITPLLIKAAETQKLLSKRKRT